MSTASLSSIAERMTAWTQQPEPPITSQHLLTYPMVTDEPMYLPDFLEMMPQHPNYYYHVARQEDIQPITSIDELPTQRSFLIKQPYQMASRSRLCSVRTSERVAWNRRCMVQARSEGEGYLLFYREVSHRFFDEYVCMMTYYDGSGGQSYRLMYTKSKIIVTPDDWIRLIAAEQLWINPDPIDVRFPQNDPNVLEKTRKSRIPVITTEGEDLIHIHAA